LYSLHESFWNTFNCYGATPRQSLSSIASFVLIKRRRNNELKQRTHNYVVSRANGSIATLQLKIKPTSGRRRRIASNVAAY